MKINGSSDSIRLNTIPARSGLTAGAKTAGTAAAAPVATVKPATDTSRTQGAMQDAPFDTAKVENLKQAIRDGRFQVDSTVVADKLAASVRDLLTTLH